MPTTARRTGDGGEPACSEAELAARLADLHAIYRGLAHDMRGPLNAIILQLELLRAELAEDARADSSRRRMERLERELERLREGAERLLAVIAPPGTGPPEWDAGELAPAVAGLVAPQARQRRVVVESTSADGPLPASGDRGDALAACLRVVVDALAVLPDGARLGISVSAGAAGDAAVFRVELDAAAQAATVSEGVARIAPESLPRSSGAVEALGGRLSVEEPAAGRAVITAALPRRLATPGR